MNRERRSGITKNPDRPDDPEYFVRLLGQVISVSLETGKVVKGLPPLDNWGLEGNLIREQRTVIGRAVLGRRWRRSPLFDIRGGRKSAAGRLLRGCVCGKKAVELCRAAGRDGVGLTVPRAVA